MLEVEHNRNRRGWLEPRYIIECEACGTRMEPGLEEFQRCCGDDSVEWAKGCVTHIFYANADGDYPEAEAFLEHAPPVHGEFPWTQSEIRLSKP